MVPPTVTVKVAVAPASSEMAAVEESKQKAYGLILGKGREVFNLENEPTVLRDRYGRNTFGQECLAARRMVEAGVPYITISFPGGWDTHGNNFTAVPQRAATLDQALSALRESVTADLQDEEAFSDHLDDLSSVMKSLEKETMRRQILERGERQIRRHRDHGPFHDICGTD